MDYYQSNRPATDDSGLSGGVSFNFNGQIATQQARISTMGSGGGGFGSNSSKGGNGGTIVTLSICVDGTPMLVDVYAKAQPYSA